MSIKIKLFISVLLISVLLSACGNESSAIAQDPIAEDVGYGSFYPDEEGTNKTSRMDEGYFMEAPIQNDNIVDLSEIYKGMPMDECISILRSSGVIKGTVYHDNFEHYGIIDCGRGISYIEIYANQGFEGNNTLYKMSIYYFVNDKETGKEMYYSLAKHFEEVSGGSVDHSEGHDFICDYFKFRKFYVHVSYSISDTYWDNDTPITYRVDEEHALRPSWPEAGPLQLVYD